MPRDGTASGCSCPRRPRSSLEHQAAMRRCRRKPAKLDLLSYGSPAPLGFDPAQATRRFEYRIGRRPGFVKGRPGMWWSINGHLFRTSRCMWCARAMSSWCTSTTATARCIRCTCMAITWSCWPATACGHRESVVGRLAQRLGQPDLRHRLRGRQPRHLDGPLPQPQTRCPGHDRAPHVRGIRHPLSDRRTRRQPAREAGRL